MVKKNTSQSFGMPKFVSLRGRTSGSFEDWRDFGDPEKLDDFFKLGVALFLHHFLTDFPLKQTKKKV